MKIFPCSKLRLAARLGFAQAFMLLALTLPASGQGQNPTLLVMGDSISAAYGMELGQSWVALLKKRLELTHPNWKVVNGSISGETTAGGLRRLPALMTTHRPSIVLIELGGNDGLRGYPINQLQNNLLALVQAAEAGGAKAIIAEMEIPPNFGSRYTTLFRESFADAADKTDAVLIPFMLADIATNPALMQADGIHPTQQAQSTILDNVWPFIQEAIEAPR
jgi:acyl-CoA thioesterase-1